MKIPCLKTAIAIAWLIASAAVCGQITSAVTYQGELEQGGVPANGEFDFEFELFNSSGSGGSVAGPITVQNVLVDGGLFSTELDFGLNPFGMTDLWLEVRVREGASGGGFTPLTPRQLVTPAPMALNAQTVAADAIASAQVAPNSLTGADLDDLLELGTNTTVTGGSSIAMGSGTTASSFVTTAMGEDTTASVRAATAMGSDTTASGFASIAMGEDTTASGTRSTAMGSFTTADGTNSTAMGSFTTAGGTNSTAIGVSTEAAGGGAIAMGNRAVAQHDNTLVWADGEIADFASTGADQFLIRAAGGVGVGTNDPQTQFDVTRNISGGASTANHVVSFVNEATNSGDVLALTSNTTLPDAAENYITFKRNGSDVGSIQGNGTGGIEFNSGGGDFAEWLPRQQPDESIEPGDIVGLYAGQVTRRTEGAQRLFVVSDRAIVVGNSLPGPGEPVHHEKVAFIGQVPVKVRGPVAPGDLIVASGRGDGTGIAVAPAAWDSQRHGLIVGQAWATASSAGVKRVTTAVGLDAMGAFAARIERQQARLDALAQGNRNLAARNQELTQRLSELERDQARSLAAFRQELARLSTAMSHARPRAQFATAGMREPE